MTRHSYGDRQYIAVQGLDKAIALVKAIMEAHDCQVLLQNDDCDIYIVSWANRYGVNDGEQFVWLSENDYDDYLDWLASKEGNNNE